MSAGELAEHLQYWQDGVKVDRYRRALAAVVAPGARILDLGSGTGLLSLLACEAGAGEVIAVEGGGIVSVVQDMVERNGVADRVQVVKAFSTALELDQPVDVIVGDQIGGFAWGAGVLRFYADAARRLLAAGGVTVPAGFELHLAPVQHQASRDAIDGWTEDPAGHDLTAVHDRVHNLIRFVVLDATDVLGPAVPAGYVAATDDRRFRATARLEVTRPGRLDGVAGMFVADMAPGVRMSNVPGHPDQLAKRWQDLHPLRRGIDVAPGDTIDAEVVVNPVTSLAAWTVAVHHADGREHVEHHSTFEGALFDPAGFRMLAGRPVQVGEVARTAAAVVAAADGGVVVPDAAAAEVLVRHPDADAQEVRNLVRELTSLLAAGPAPDHG